MYQQSTQPTLLDFILASRIALGFYTGTLKDIMALRLGRISDTSESGLSGVFNLTLIY